MTLRDFIEKLESIEQNEKCLSKHTGLKVETFKWNENYGVVCTGEESGCAKFSYEFDNIESMNTFLEAMCIGAMLAKGLEV